MSKLIPFVSLLLGKSCFHCSRSRRHSFDVIGIRLKSSRKVSRFFILRSVLAGVISYTACTSCKHSKAFNFCDKCTSSCSSMLATHRTRNFSLKRDFFLFRFFFVDFFLRKKSTDFHATDSTSTERKLLKETYAKDRKHNIVQLKKII